jgi:dihydrodipicolinate synthase/N-acetylneuraminate lyase
MPDYDGLFVATLTPFDSGDRVDPKIIRDHVRFLVDGGAAGLCPAGTTGEFLYLSLGEKVRVVEETVRAADGRVPVIAGVWALTATEIAMLARGARDGCADAVFLPPPIYYPASDEVVYRHYAAVRDAAGLPVFAYNIPSYAGNTVTTACLERLVADGVVIGVKDSSAKTDRMTALVQQFASRIRVMAASDSFATEGRKLGAHGFISALANVFPRSFAKLWDGDESLQPAVDALRNAVKAAGGNAAIKRLATRRGFAFGASRLPFSDLDASQLATVDAAYDAAVAAGLV